MRNPFRITFRPGTGEIWSGDVGWNEYEEINRTQNIAQVRNYGWPCYEGAPRMGSYDSLDIGSCETLYNQGAGAVTAPYYAYRHAESVVTDEGCPTRLVLDLRPALLHGQRSFPAQYRDALFFSDYSRNSIWVAYTGADGLPDMSTRQIFASQANGPVWLTQGPDGALYYADLSGGTVRRIASDNGAPTARITATPRTGVVPLTVNFDGTASTDPENRTLTYAWDLDGDGAYDDSTAARPSFTYRAPGTVTVRLRVTDPGGLSGTTTETITIGAPPTVSITVPRHAVGGRRHDRLLRHRQRPREPADVVAAAAPLLAHRRERLPHARDPGLRRRRVRQLRRARPRVPVPPRALPDRDGHGRADHDSRRATLMPAHRRPDGGERTGRAGDLAGQRDAPDAVHAHGARPLGEPGQHGPVAAVRGREWTFGSWSGASAERGGDRARRRAARP